MLYGKNDTLPIDEYGFLYGKTNPIGDECDFLEIDCIIDDLYD